MVDVETTAFISEEANMHCSRNLQLFMTSLVSIGYITVVIGLSLSAMSVFTARKTFHPFFMMFFLPFLIFYTLCTVGYVILDWCTIFGLPEDHVIPSYTNFMVFMAYRTNSPLIIFFLLERLYSTTHSGSYEKSRPWCLFGPLIPLGVLLSLMDLYLLKREFLAPALEQYTLVALECINLVLLCILHLINKRLIHRQTFSGVRLSNRYQLTENVRVLRLIIPVVVWDFAITTEDQLVQIYFKINHYFDTGRCGQEPAYLFQYVCFNLLSILIISWVPLSVLLSHPVVKKAARQILCCRRQVVPERKPKKLVNVLGEDIKQTQTTQEHFANLYSQWS